MFTLVEESKPDDTETNAVIIPTAESRDSPSPSPHSSPTKHAWQETQKTPHTPPDTVKSAQKLPRNKVCPQFNLVPLKLFGNKSSKSAKKKKKGKRMEPVPILSLTKYLSQENVRSVHNDDIVSCVSIMTASSTSLEPPSSDNQSPREERKLYVIHELHEDESAEEILLKHPSCETLESLGNIPESIENDCEKQSLEGSAAEDKTDQWNDAQETSEGETSENRTKIEDDCEPNAFANEEHPTTAALSQEQCVAETAISKRLRVPMSIPIFTVENDFYMRVCAKAKYLESQNPPKAKFQPKVKLSQQNHIEKNNSCLRWRPSSSPHVFSCHDQALTSEEGKAYSKFSVQKQVISRPHRQKSACAKFKTPTYKPRNKNFVKEVINGTVVSSENNDNDSDNCGDNEDNNEKASRPSSSNSNIRALTTAVKNIKTRKAANEGRVNPAPLIEYLQIVRDNPEEYAALFGGARTNGNMRHPNNVLISIANAFTRGQSCGFRRENPAVQAAYELGCWSVHPVCANYEKYERQKLKDVAVMLQNKGRLAASNGKQTVLLKDAGQIAAGAADTPMSTLQIKRAEVESWLRGLTTSEVILVRNAALRELGLGDKCIDRWWDVNKHCRYLRVRQETVNTNDDTFTADT